MFDFHIALSGVAHGAMQTRRKMSKRTALRLRWVPYASLLDHALRGEMFIVPKGIEHKPVAEDECRILLIEPAGTVNTGDVVNEMTAKTDVWI